MAGGVLDPLNRPALQTALASRSVLLAMAQTEGRIVAVGERGIVISSDDQGKSWRQGKTPVSVTLNSVAFASAKVGWAAGQGGVVLKTVDGGDSWALQLDGNKLLSQLEKSAQFSEAELSRWKKEGADKPFLALTVINPQSLVVVGAYGLAFRSRDGGASWEYFGDKLNNRGGNHLYALAIRDNKMFISGERGSLYVSGDDGANFERLELPYKGGLFVLHATSKGIFAAGMKGKLLFTPDLGKTWADVPNPIPVSLLGVAALTDGRQLWINQGGQFLIGAEDAQGLIPLDKPMAPAGLQALPVKDKRLVIAGFRGMDIQQWDK